MLLTTLRTVLNTENAIKLVVTSIYCCWLHVLLACFIDCTREYKVYKNNKNITPL
jgi:hypothetical protein